MPSRLPTVGCMRDYFAYDPPTTTSNKNDSNGTCCKCSNPAEVFFGFFLPFTDEQPTPRGLYLSHSRLSLPRPLFFGSLLFVVCAHFQNSLKRQEREGWRWLGGMGPEGAERGSRGVKGEGLG